MKIAIIGSSGYIASFLMERFCGMKDTEILRIDQTKDADLFLDLLNAEVFDYSVLNDVDYVIFTAAISGPDQCASEFEKCWKINVEGTTVFIKNAIQRGCKVIFFSSDAVFGDVPGEIYTELSETKAQTPYGRMKKAVEDEFKANDKFKAIRLSYVVSAKDRFVKYCLSCIREEKTAEVFHPFYRNCITVSNVVDVVSWLINNWDTYEPWVLNVAGKELVSRVRIADELNRILGGKLRYSIISPSEEFYVNRPRITQMKSLYLNSYMILKDYNFTEKIQNEVEELDYE